MTTILRYVLTALAAAGLLWLTYYLGRSHEECGFGDRCSAS